MPGGVLAIVAINHIGLGMFGKDVDVILFIFFIRIFTLP